jgi:hypothetical protein
VTEPPSLASLDVEPDALAAAQPDPDAPNQATALFALARTNYRLMRSEDGETYAVRRNGPNIAIPVARGGPFGSHLIRLFYEAESKIPSDEAERSAVKLMRAYLADQEPESVHLRVAQHGPDCVVLDLGTADGSCVLVTADGWRIEPRSPVVFRRAAALPLPEPQRDVDGLARLRVLVNASDDQLRLGVSWLVAALIPAMPHPILLPRGEQGSAKTTLSRILQAVIDPSGLKPGALPRDERDFAVRMTAAYVQAFDNVSAIPPWLSDALCRAATGDSFVTRTLYTDRDVTILQYSRPIILNTIDAGALSGDLVERSLPLDLDRIPPEKRRTERAVIGDDPDTNPGLYDQLDKDRPVILGAVLDLVADVLRHVPQVTTGPLPRMADFGRVLAALDAAQGWDIGGVFSDLVDSETGALIEGNPFASRLVEFMEDRDEWSGTATALLDELTALLPDKDHPPRRWPADPTRAGGQLRRLAPSLRVHGIEVESARKGKVGRRTLEIRKLASAASAASADRLTSDDRSTLTDAADAGKAQADAADAGRRCADSLASAIFPQADGSLSASADAADANSAAISTSGWSEGSHGATANTDSSRPTSEVGPCARCGARCHRYGDSGHALCAACETVD